METVVADLNSHFALAQDAIVTSFTEASAQAVAHYDNIQNLFPLALKELSPYIDFSQLTILGSMLFFVANPLIWNIIARTQYRSKWMTKLFGDKYRACYFLACCIFTAGIYRDFIFTKAMQTQPTWNFLASPSLQLLAYVLYFVGLVFVITSTIALGITGTFLGDYFDIYLPKKVEGFPFNVNANPMYNGATMIFVAHALHSHSPAGLFLSAWAFLVYQIALKFEEPFTDMIYRKKAEREKKQDSQRKAKKFSN
eukprot:GCRY01002583.1.p1 GENE.GCRY01002583.1~~GCRY01002583.1.p1  ORF type:complete len:275 (+),score=49.11 GCRY01002583.1:65-826(+)